MSAMLPMSDAEKVKMPDWISQMRSGLFAIILGACLGGLALFVFIPADTYSTAKWYDELGIRHIVEGQTTFFAFINATPLTNEGFYVSVFTSVMNISLAYLVVFSGPWLVGVNKSNLIDAIKAVYGREYGKVNWVKILYFVLLIAVTVIETLTGADFRGGGAAPDAAVAATNGARIASEFVQWLKAAGVAFIIENLGSDFALAAGSQMFLTGMFQVWDSYVSGKADIRDLSNFLSGKGTPNHSPQQPQKYQTPNGGGGKKGGGRDQQPQKHGGGNRQPAMGDGRGAPQPPTSRKPSEMVHPNFNQRQRPPEPMPTLSDTDEEELHEILAQMQHENRYRG